MPRQLQEGSEALTWQSKSFPVTTSLFLLYFKRTYSCSSIFAGSVGLNHKPQYRVTIFSGTLLKWEEETSWCIIISTLYSYSSCGNVSSLFCSFKFCTSAAFLACVFICTRITRRSAARCFCPNF